MVQNDKSKQFTLQIQRRKKSKAENEGKMKEMTVFSGMSMDVHVGVSALWANLFFHSTAIGVGNRDFTIVTSKQVL